MVVVELEPDVVPSVVVVLELELEPSGVVVVLELLLLASGVVVDVPVVSVVVEVPVVSVVVVELLLELPSGIGTIVVVLELDDGGADDCGGVCCWQATNPNAIALTAARAPKRRVTMAMLKGPSSFGEPGVETNRGPITSFQGLAACQIVDAIRLGRLEHALLTCR